MTVTIDPETEAVATSASELAAAKVRSSPSGSLKFSATSTVTESPTLRVWSSIVPVTSGALLVAFTVTAIVCVADSPPGSRAVIVTVAEPAATPVVDTTLPDTVAVATPPSEVAAE